MTPRTLAAVLTLIVVVVIVNAVLVQGRDRAQVKAGMKVVNGGQSA